MNNLVEEFKRAHGLTVRYFQTINSTNLYLKDLIKRGETPPDLVIARGQTDGRGRSGKSFYSPEGTGLYLTFCLLNQEIVCSDVTARVALCVARALDSVFDCRCGVKWVNDVYLNQRKIAGVLCQSVGDFVLIGIGVNVEMPKMIPEDLEFRFGSVVQSCDPERYPALVRALYRELALVLAEEKTSVLSEYRERLVHLHTAVQIESNGALLEGKCLGIGDDFSLHLEINEKQVSFQSGYMTLKIKKNDC